MLFNSFEFLIFFPVVLILYYVLPHRSRWLFLVLASYYFYAVGEPYLIGLLMFSTLTDYYCGLKIGTTEDQRTKKIFLWTSIIINIGILVSFKYLFFLWDSLNGLLEQFGIQVEAAEKIQGYRIDQILLPIGISFYTFQTMSYTIDVYRGNVNPEKHFGRFALFVAFFPQLVAGPIERASRMLPQFKKIVLPDAHQIKRGLIFMAWGFFMKIVVADRLGMYVDVAYADPEGNRGLPLILAAFFFVFQIYFDFAGYTYIAIGAAKCMGIILTNNFNRPLFSQSITQFWQRWHISLTHWIRDYLYRPLTRNANIDRTLAVLIVFSVMGLWHGANWTFVVWGILNAVFLIVEMMTYTLRRRIFEFLGVGPRIRGLLGWGAAFSFMLLSLIFFRAPSIGDAVTYFQNLFIWPNLHFNILNNYFELILSFALILGVQLVHYYKGNNKIYELVEAKPVWARWSIYFIYLILILLFGVNSQQSFIYFQF